MTKKEWQCVKDAWFKVFWFKFREDKDIISLNLHISKKGQAGYIVYVNDFLEGKWLTIDRQYPEQKYLHRITKFASNKTQRRLAELQGQAYKPGTYTYYDFEWRSFQVFKRHFDQVAPDMRLEYPECESGSESQTP